MHHVSARREDLLALANLALQVSTRTPRRVIRFDALDNVQRSRRVRGLAVYLVGMLLIVTGYMTRRMEAWRCFSCSDAATPVDVWLDERKSGGGVFSVTAGCLV
jgi:hypothetical protein